MHAGILNASEKPGHEGKADGSQTYQQIVREKKKGLFRMDLAVRGSDLDLDLEFGIQQPLEKSEAKIWIRVGTALPVLTKSLRSVLGT